MCARFSVWKCFDEYDTAAPCFIQPTKLLDVSRSFLLWRDRSRRKRSNRYGSWVIVVVGQRYFLTIHCCVAPFNEKISRSASQCCEIFSSFLTCWSWEKVKNICAEKHSAASLHTFTIKLSKSNYAECLGKFLSITNAFDVLWPVRRISFLWPESFIKFWGFRWSFNEELEGRGL